MENWWKDAGKEISKSSEKPIPVPLSSSKPTLTLLESIQSFIGERPETNGLSSGTALRESYSHLDITLILELKKELCSIFNNRISSRKSRFFPMVDNLKHFRNVYSS
jgi:hypothetical protein